MAIKNNSSLIGRSISEYCSVRKRQRRMSIANTSASFEMSNLIDEIADTVSPLPVVEDNNKHRYNLRSRGKLNEIPLPIRSLEYSRTLHK